MDKSMTGDGAAVRQDEARAYAERLIEQAAKLKVKPTIEELEAMLNGPEPQIYMNPDGSYNADGDLLNLARHTLAQAAEIERLTRERDHWIAADEDRGRQLIAEMERRVDTEARNADLLKALGAADRLVDWLRINRERRELPADFEEVAGMVAAAKGDRKP